MKTLPLLLLLAGLVQAWTVTFDTLPKDFQLYPRDASDSGTAVISGKVAGQGIDSIVVNVKKSGQPFRRTGTSLIYSGDTAAFSLSIRIVSELAEYGFTINADAQLAGSADSVVCGDAYVITGQSNAEAGGTGAYDWQIPEWVRSTGYVNSGNGSLSAVWARASFRCCFGNWPYGASNGPNGAGMVGANLGKLIAAANLTPVCIINGAYSGTVIEQHQRNNADHADTLTLYGRVLRRAQTAGLTNDIKAILYYQGEYHNGTQTYPGLFDNLYKAWKEDFPAVRKVYIEQINTGCDTNGNAKIRDIQRNFAETYGDITVMTACGISGYTGCHFTDNGYLQIAQWWQPVYGRDFYGAPGADITSPRILSAAFTTGAHTALDLTFDMPVVWPADTLGYKMKDYVTLDKAWGLIDSTRVIGNVLRLYLSAASNATAVSYIPLSYYRDNPASAYMGPYLRSVRNIGALTFLDFPISASSVAEPGGGNADPGLSLSATPNPFNPKVTFILGHTVGLRSLTVYNSLGKKVADLTAQARTGKAVWEPALPSGMYVAKLIAGNKTLGKRLILMR